MPPTRSLTIALAGVLIVLAGCSSGGNATPTTGAPAASQPAASAGDVSQPAATPVDASGQPAAGGGSGTLSGDPCKLVTAGDVIQIYGGSVSPLAADDTDSCRFEITGKALAGNSAAIGEFAVTFNGDWNSYDDEKVVFGDEVKKIDGLGTDAYEYMGYIHTKVGSDDLVVGGTFVGDYDRPKLDQETFDMAKLVLSRV